MQPKPSALPPEIVPAWESVKNIIQVSVPQSELRDAILDDCAYRDEKGRKTYGVALHYKNGRNHLLDAYEEALDSLVYIFCASVEAIEQELDNSEDYRRAFVLQWDQCETLRRLLDKQPM